MTKRMRPAVRLSPKEKMIVQYITERLEAVSQNAAGKPIYARNMDQVMKDLFDVKKFTKTLERARGNETLMINLMKKLDAEVMWRLCRSKEYYRILCTLVAMDASIVRDGKKYNKLMSLEPMERPSNKIRKLAKEIKKNKKTYKECIKSLADILGIEKRNSKEGSLRDALEDWLDQREAEDDIFFDTDLTDLSYDTLSDMDAYVAGNTRKRSSKIKSEVNARYGALGLGLDGRDQEDEDDYFDTDDYDDQDRDDYDEDEVMDRLADKVIEKMQHTNGGRNNSRGYGQSSSNDGQMQMLAQIITSSINNGFKKLADALTEADSGYDDDDHYVEGEEYELNGRAPRPTLYDMMDEADAQANGSNPPVDDHPTQPQQIPNPNPDVVV